MKFLIERFSFFFYRIYLKINYQRIISSKKSRVQKRIFFGPTPIINSKYWASALKEFGMDAVSFSPVKPELNNLSDFDQNLEEILNKNKIYRFLKKRGWAAEIFNKLVLFNYVSSNFDVVVMSYDWTFFSDTKYAEKEGVLLRHLSVKAIIIPYGGDFWQYSKVCDQSYKMGLMIHYPDSGINEDEKSKNIRYWNKMADLVLLGISMDGSNRNDLFSVSTLCIDTREWQLRKNYSMNDGKNGEVVIVHSPNHRYIKGTEFLLTAVEQLQKEGLKIKFLLLEKLPNDEVKRILREEADILVEKLIYSVYGLSGLEGLSCGLPVVSNLDHEMITRSFRRYSYLDECPIVSADPEDIYETLKLLITNPGLRRELGQKSRQYAEKFHSYPAFAWLFQQIMKKLFVDNSINLKLLYHPLLKDSFNNQQPRITHNLIDNKITVNSPST